MLGMEGPWSTTLRLLQDPNLLSLPPAVWPYIFILGWGKISLPQFQG